ncbi:MAG: alkaline phosphatase family protein [Vulcanimicrobiota bacterium]
MGLFSLLFAVAVHGSLVHYPTGNWVTAPGALTGEAKSRQILLVTVGGLRTDTAARLQLWAQAARQGATGVLASEIPSFDWPNLTAAVTGTPPDLSGILTDLHPGPASVDTLMLRLAQSGRDSVVAGSYAWSVLFGGQFADSQRIALGEAADADRQVTAALADFLSGEHALVVGEYRNLDEVGHRHGVGQEYAEAALALDTQLQQLLAGVDLSQTTLVLVSTHGLSQAGGCGGREAEVLSCPVLMLGAGVRPGSHIDGQLRDLAPTLAVLLGLPYPADSIGNPLFEGLLLDQGGAARLVHLADDQRRSMATSMLLSEGYSAYPELDGKEALRQRVKLRARGIFWRWPLGFAWLALPVYIFMKLDRRQNSTALAQAMAWGFLVTVSFHALVLLVGGGYSPSHITSFSQLRNLVVFSGLLGLFLTTFFAFLRGLRPEPGRAAGSGLQVFIGATLWMEAHLLVYATIYGFPGQMDVPNPSATLICLCVVGAMVGIAIGAPIGPWLARQASRWRG